MIKFNKLNNNCYFLEINKNVILISYETIIGFIFNNTLILNKSYVNYSKTTNKHINLFRNNLIFLNENILSEKYFNNLFENVFNNENDYLKKQYIKYEKNFY